MAIMSLNLKSKFKPVLNNLCRTFCNAPLPDVCSKEDKSKFIVAQSTGPGSLKCLFISIEDTTTTTALKVEKYIDYPKLYHNPVSTCNGLVLLLFDGSYDKDTDTKTSPAGEALWNPTTNQLKILSTSPATLDPRFLKSSCMYFGFGFDLASEDYKVIRFLGHKGKDTNQVNRGHQRPVMAELYSLATNSWKPVNMLAFANPSSGIHINGSYYWLNSSEPGFIMSFNFASEKFASYRVHVPQSDKLDRFTFSNLKLVEFRGSLGAIVHSLAADPLCSFEVWVWDDGRWAWSLASTFDVPISMSNEWSLVGSDKLIFVDVKQDMMFFDYATGKLENIAGAPKAFVAGILPFVVSYVTLS